jgi:hypothetical protein
MLISSSLSRTVNGRAHNTRRSTRMLGMGAWCAAAALCVFAIAPRHAHALNLSGDLDYVDPVSSNYDKGGWGFGIRVGEELHLPLLALTPEIGFTYASFADVGPSVYRGIVGANLGIGEVLRFGVSAHIGFGHVSVESLPALELVGEVTHTAFTWDGGLFLELTLLPIINVGIHAAYNSAAGKDNADGLHWITAGAHATFVF